MVLDEDLGTSSPFVLLFTSSMALGCGVLPSVLMDTCEKSGCEKANVARSGRIFVVIAVVLIKNEDFKVNHQ